MRRRMLALLACMILLGVFVATGLLTGATRRPTPGQVHCTLYTVDGEPAAHSVTETGDLSLQLTVTVGGSQVRDFLFTLFMDGAQVAPSWGDAPSLTHRVLVEPGTAYTVPLCLSGISAGMHCMHLCSVALPDPESLLNEDQLMSSDFWLDAYPFTVQSRSVIEPAPQPAMLPLSVVTGVSDRFSAADETGALCVSPAQLVIDPSFDIRDRQKLWYFWHNRSPRERELQLTLLVDWRQVKWPGKDVISLQGHVSDGGTVIQEIDLSGLELQRASQITVVAFVQPGRPFWQWDADGPVIPDPEGGRAYGSNRVVVFSP